MLLFVFSFSVFTTGQEKGVFVKKNGDEFKITINGKPFFIKGMNWDFYPVGTNYTYSLWSQPDRLIKAALDYEMQLAGMNATMAPDLQTVFLPAATSSRPITATLVRQIAKMGGLLHDIGKLGVSNTILDKPSALDDAEFEIQPLAVFFLGITRRHAERLQPAFKPLDGLAAQFC